MPKFIDNFDPSEKEQIRDAAKKSGVPEEFIAYNINAGVFWLDDLDPEEIENIWLGWKLHRLVIRGSV